jgi:hypothetical protein
MWVTLFSTAAGHLSTGCWRNKNWIIVLDKIQAQFDNDTLLFSVMLLIRKNNRQ